MNRTFIIYACSFDENVGGVIVLHRLCDLLNHEKQRALIWPATEVVLNPWRPIYTLHRLRMSWRWHRKHGQFKTFGAFDTPLATKADLNDDAVVIYPEVVDHNPLRAKNVVRWLLHRPGFHTGRIKYGIKDKYFFFQEAFNEPSLNSEADNLLRTMFVRDDIYRQTHFGPREGSCHIIRKGKNRPLIHHASDSLLIDGMSHQEAAAVFNRVRLCISYDPYTMYSQFAAMCGCESIVIPEEGMTLDSWYPDPRDRYGVAFGTENLEEARRTARLLLPHLKEQERTANKSVRRFVEKCEGYFE